MGELDCFSITSCPELLAANIGHIDQPLRCICHSVGIYLDKISPLSGFSSLGWPLLILPALEGHLSSTFCQAGNPLIGVCTFSPLSEPRMHLPPSGAGTVVLSRKAGDPGRDWQRCPGHQESLWLMVYQKLEKKRKLTLNRASIS